jgi:hypothetical protein
MASLFEEGIGASYRLKGLEVEVEPSVVQPGDVCSSDIIVQTFDISLSVYHSALTVTCKSTGESLPSRLAQTFVRWSLGLQAISWLPQIHRFEPKMRAKTNTASVAVSSHQHIPAITRDPQFSAVFTVPEHGSQETVGNRIAPDEVEARLFDNATHVRGVLMLGLPGKPMPSWASSGGRALYRLVYQLHIICSCQCHSNSCLLLQSLSLTGSH